MVLATDYGKHVLINWHKNYPNNSSTHGSNLWSQRLHKTSAEWLFSLEIASNLTGFAPNMQTVSLPSCIKCMGNLFSLS